VSDVVLEMSVEHPWPGATQAQEWTGLRRISPSTANQRPTLSGKPLSGLRVARDSSITLTQADLVIADDYAELGADLILAYPPLAGQILDADGNALDAGGMIAVSPVTSHRLRTSREVPDAGRPASHHFHHHGHT